MRWIFALGLSGLLAGCATSGVKVSEQQAESFKVGTSTYNAVIATLGQPTATTMNTDGTRIAAYSYASIRSQPQKFIPDLGPLVAGSSGFVTFAFDERGVLTGTTSSQTEIAAGANVAADSNAATPPYEVALRSSLPGERQ
jgi:hypothetical protein